MRQIDLWRTTPFRLSVLNGAIFALGVVALLALIYAQTAGYMRSQMDAVVMSGERALLMGGPTGLPDRVRQAVEADSRGTEYYALFSADGVRIAGNVARIPLGLAADGKPHALATKPFQSGSRAMVERLPWGELLFVGHDAKVLTGVRDILVRALALSGAAILCFGLLMAAAFSLEPLRRIRALQTVSRQALQGRLGVRLPVSRRRDEMDMLAALANAMMDETERLLWEVKSVGDNVAHDLRTPLNRLRGLLHRTVQDGRLEPAERGMIEDALSQTDELLNRFRALVRIGEIERRDRQALFAQVRLQTVVDHAFELYEPLAEDRGVTLLRETCESGAEVFADPTLLFEAVANLLDNALKFTPRGGLVRLRLSLAKDGPILEVADNGPGVPEHERAAVLTRFYRSERTSDRPGSGLGLSLVAAVARLHHFRLNLSDAGPGLRVVLDCWPRELEA